MSDSMEMSNFSDWVSKVKDSYMRLLLCLSDDELVMTGFISIYGWAFVTMTYIHN